MSMGVNRVLMNCPSDVRLLVGVRVVAVVEHGQVEGAALLRVHALVGGHGGGGVRRQQPGEHGGPVRDLGGPLRVLVVGVAEARTLQMSSD